MADPVTITAIVLLALKIKSMFDKLKNSNLVLGQEKNRLSGLVGT